MTTYDVHAEPAGSSGGGGSGGGSGGSGGGSSGGGSGSSGSSGAGTDGLTVGKEQPAMVVITEHQCDTTSTYQSGGSTSTQTRSKKYQAERAEDGSVNFHGSTTDRSTSDSVWNQAAYEWTATNKLVNYTSSDGPPSSDADFVEYFQGITGVPDKSVSELGWAGTSGGVGGYPPTFIHHYSAKGVEHQLVDDTIVAKVSVTAATEQKLYTGGKAKVSRKNLFCLTANAETESYGAPLEYPWLHTPATPVAAASIEINGQPVDSDKRLYTVLPDNASPVVTVTVKGAKHYNAGVGAMKYKCQFEVFVRQPYPRYPDDLLDYGDAGPPLGYPIYSSILEAGHAWWRLTSDAPVEAVNQFTSTNCSQLLNQEVGYGPTADATLISVFPPIKEGPGILYTNNGSPNIHKTFEIGFSSPGLIDGLNYAESIHINPGTWNSSSRNCVHETIKTGKATGVALPYDETPEMFGYYLRSYEAP